MKFDDSRMVLKSRDSSRKKTVNTVKHLGNPDWYIPQVDKHVVYVWCVMSVNIQQSSSIMFLFDIANHFIQTVDARATACIFFPHFHAQNS